MLPHVMRAIAPPSEEVVRFLKNAQVQGLLGDPQDEINVCRIDDRITGHVEMGGRLHAVSPVDRVDYQQRVGRREDGVATDNRRAFTP